MNAKTFFDEVVKMRKLQQKYFKDKSPFALEDAKRQERIIDEEIKKVQVILNKQLKIF